MTDVPRPTPENEALWRRRFALFALLRVSGLVMIIAGIAIGLSDILRPGGWPLLGVILLVCGVIDGIAAPRILRRRWKG